MQGDWDHDDCCPLDKAMLSLLDDEMSPCCGATSPVALPDSACHTPTVTSASPVRVLG